MTSIHLVYQAVTRICFRNTAWQNQGEVDGITLILTTKLAVLTRYGENSPPVFRNVPSSLAFLWFEGNEGFMEAAIYSPVTL